MTLVQLTNLKKSFGGQDVLVSVDASIFEGHRIGLIGSNGAGKTTLFKIILGDLTEDAGEVVRKKDLKVAYLPQIPEENPGMTVMDIALQGYPDLLRMEREIARLEEKMAHAPGEEMGRLIDEHDRLLHQFRDGGGYRYRSHTQSILNGLGFPQSTYSQPLSTLSGGQKNRLALVRTLLGESDLVLLDEPTNFLDIESTEWLEEYLKAIPTSMLIISHDRYFLNKVVSETWELSFGKLVCYKGNYDSFQIQKKQNEERLQALHDRQEEEIKRQEDFVRRNIYGQKHSMAQSRRKMIDKIERVEAPMQEDVMKLSIASINTRSDKVVEAKNLGFSYSGLHLFSGLSFLLRSGEKMAIIGRNGCGKSTLLHLIVNRLQPKEGELSVGAKVSVGFYHQELEGLSPQESVFDTIKERAPTMDDLPIRNFLALFLFRGDDIYKKVKDLSGGEKGRLALARLLVQKPNFLVLDEPTNHLDISSRQALEEALKEYEGTLLFVSHDRYFIDQVAERILYFHRQRCINFHGNYSRFAESKENLLPPDEEEKGKKKRNAYEKMVQVREKKPKKRYTLEELESRIIQAEEKLKEITGMLGNDSVYQNPDRVRELKIEYDKTLALLEEWNREWESWAS